MRSMKKVYTCVFALVCCLGFAACGNNEEAVPVVTTAAATQAPETTTITTAQKEETTTTKKKKKKKATETTLKAKNSEQNTTSIKVVIEEAPSTSTADVWHEDTTTTTTMLVNELNFNSQYGYVPVEIGFNSGISLAGYDDGKFYEVGDSPIEFTIDDEKIAKVGVVQGVGVNVLGVSVGETVLNAKAPDGRTASIKVIVKEAPSTSTTAVWNDATTTITTVEEHVLS